MCVCARFLVRERIQALKEELLELLLTISHHHHHHYIEKERETKGRQRKEGRSEEKEKERETFFGLLFFPPFFPSSNCVCMCVLLTQEVGGQRVERICCAMSCNGIGGP